MRKICRFYCCDCDYAWIEFVEENKELPSFYDKCDYCKKPQEAEEIENINEN